MEQVRGIEPPLQPWEGRVLPLNHTCITYILSFFPELSQSLFQGGFLFYTRQSELMGIL